MWQIALFINSTHTHIPVDLSGSLHPSLVRLPVALTSPRDTLSSPPILKMHLGSRKCAAQAPKFYLCSDATRRALPLSPFVWRTPRREKTALSAEKTRHVYCLVEMNVLRKKLRLNRGNNVNEISLEIEPLRVRFMGLCMRTCEFLPVRCCVTQFPKFFEIIYGCQQKGESEKQKLRMFLGKLMMNLKGWFVEANLRGLLMSESITTWSKVC